MRDDAVPAGNISGILAKELTSLCDLHEDGGLLRIITENLPVLIAYLDTEQRFRFSNLQHQRWWARREEEILGATIREIVGEENYSSIKDHLALALRGTACEVCTSATYPGVGDKFVQVSYVPHVEYGSVIGVIVLVEDLTAEHRALEKLSNQERELKLILNTVPAMIWYKDKENRIIELNELAAQAVGLPLNEVRGRSTYDLFPYEDAEKYHKDDLEVIQTGAPKIGIVEALSLANEEKRWVRTAKVPYRDGTGMISGVLVFAIDITAEIAAQEHKRVLERSLQESQKMQALGTFARGIAHDFNNIIGGLIGYADLTLHDQRCTPEIQENLTKIKGAALRARALVERIHTFSSGAAVSREMLNLSEMLTEVASFSRPLLPAGVQIQLELPEQPCFISANPIELHQVFTNLITNAAHAIQLKGSGVILLSYSEKESPFTRSRYASITVQDNGTGIPKQLRARIFEPYFTTKKNKVGTGLGLSVVHGIVKAYGGSLNVDSVEGEYTKVTVDIPLEGTSHTSVDVARGADLGNSTPHVTRPLRSILFIDDDQMLVELGSQTLIAMGYEVTAYTDPRKALLLFLEKPDRFDLVISDLIMPELDGRQLVQELRKIDKNFPVLLCTGDHSVPRRGVEVVDDPHTKILCKPYTIEQLASALAVFSS